MPSPTKATLRPPSAQPLDRLDLALRQDLGNHLVDAELAGDGLGGAALSPVTIAVLQADAACRAAIACGGLGLTGSATATTAASLPSMAA